MADNYSQARVAPKKREQAICMYCRRKKVKCTPIDRIWTETDPQKCQSCQEKDLPCSRNYRSKSDPFVLGRDAGYTDHVAGSSISQEPREEHHAMAPGASRTASVDKTATPFLETRSEPEKMGAANRTTRFASWSLDQLRQEASAILTEFEVFMEVLELEAKHSRLRLSPNCPDETHSDYGSKCIVHAIRRKVHESFLDICDRALEMDHRGKEDAACLLLSRLLFASKLCLQIYDGRKQNYLIEVWAFFNRLGYRALEHFLVERITEIWADSKLPLDEILCKEFAKSLVKSSKTTRKVLGVLWRDEFREEEIPEHIDVPPHLRASQLCAPVAYRVVSEGIDNILGPNVIPPGMFKLKPLHIASSLGSILLLTAVRRAHELESIDERDENSQTALFMAAARGHHECCQHLLKEWATVDDRDDHGHTVLEAAVRGGHYKCAELLIMRSNAPVDSPLAGGSCASTPIQAAFENQHINHDIVTLLIKNEADAFTGRTIDDKSAIQLAEDRGESLLAKYMREKGHRPAAMTDNYLFRNLGFQ